MPAGRSSVLPAMTKASRHSNSASGVSGTAISGRAKLPRKP